MLEQEFPRVSSKHCPYCGKPLIEDEDSLSCHGRCDFGPEPKKEVEGAKVWKNQPDDDHTWAFYYQLRRADDCAVRKRKSKDGITIIVNEQLQYE